MVDIGSFSLKNNGAFVAKLEFEYFNKNTNKWVRTKGTGNITVGKSVNVSPDDYGVPEGSRVRIHVNVVAGKDNTSKDEFMYKKSNGSTANYSISGTTLKNSLKYDGITQISIPVSKADIGSFSLKNNGAFVAKLEFEYFNKNTNKWVRTKGTGNITVGKSVNVSPGDYGVPEGSRVRIQVNVVTGNDKTSNEVFTYKKCNGSTANYTVSGTTLINSLKPNGITQISIPVSEADIGSFSLHNNSTFVVKLEFEYFDKCKYDWVRTKVTGDITVGESKKVSPSDYGVPEGSLVRFVAFVVAGSDKFSKAFMYKKSNENTATYVIVDTTLNNIGMLYTSIFE